MSTPSRTQPDEEAAGGTLRADRIAVSVLKELGKPAELYRVTVMRLWGNHYRVNVQAGADAVSARIAHSFFLEADEAGMVLVSTPAIARLY